MSQIATGSESGSLRLKVTGMHCAGCASTIQRVIEAQPGVVTAAVSHSSGRARVTGNDLPTAEIVAAVRAKGFDAEIVEPTGAGAALSDIERRQNAHERMWRLRAIVGLSLWAPLELGHWIAAANGWHMAWMPWVMFAGSTIVIAVAGWGFYRSAWNAARKRTTNMDTLISMGATTAFVYSTIVLVFGIDEPMYFAEAAGLLGIVSLGHWMEARSSAKAGSSVRELLQLQPEEAERLDDTDAPHRIPTADVEPGDRLLVRPGSRIPVDGVVLEGASEVDESIVTGESLPVAKHAGSKVIAGSVNTTGRLTVEASVDGQETTVNRIAEMVQDAQTSRAPVQRLADRISAVFVPVVLSIALVTLLGWWLIAGDLTTGVVSATTVLIISCPCALGLATPMAVMVGTGAASKRGILIKSAMTLEQTARARRIIFDKTGTLTEGRPVVTSITEVAAGWSKNDVLAIAAAVEHPSEHPVGRAIVAAAIERQLNIVEVSDFETLPGEGVRGTVDGSDIVVRRDDQATCSITVDGTIVGRMMLADAPRADAQEAVARLRSMGFHLAMLTGDREEIARAVGAELGFGASEVIAEARPDDKSRYIAQHAADSVMVGDGINDAAALATADVGVALASGTTIAIESADVVIPGERVRAIPELIDLARRTMRAIRQNLFFAFFYNATAIPLAAFGVLGPLGPLIGAAAMGLSDLTVIGNALRLKWQLERERNEPDR